VIRKIINRVFLAIIVLLSIMAALEAYVLLTTPTLRSVASTTTTIVPATRQMTPRPITTTLRKDDEYYKQLVTSTLSSSGVDVSSVMIANGRNVGGEKILIVSYNSRASSEEEVLREIGWVVGSFVGVRKGDRQGKAIGTFYCKKEWVDRYIAGTLSVNELFLKVLNTMQKL